MKKLNARIFGVTAMVAMVCLLIAGQAMAFNQDGQITGDERMQPVRPE